MAPKRAQEAFRGATDPSAQGTLPEAPTFHPTAAEFAHPLRYILSIREEAEKYGICAIVPPADWKPPFCLDRNRLQFPARVQRINELMVRKVQRLRFLQDLAAFWDARGAPLKPPSVGGKPVDLHLLHSTVRSFGGYDAATAERRWPRVAEALHLDCSAAHASSVAKKHYESLLKPFDEARGGEAALGAGGATGAPSASGAAVEAADGVPAANGAGGGLLSRRGGNAQLVKLSATELEGRETSNAGMYVYLHLNPTRACINIHIRIYTHHHSRAPTPAGAAVGDGD